jgi:RimJ/RimL family protein N-acetyltransferase
VTLKSDKTLLGSCAISNTYSESVESFIGWHYGSEFWGNGYATEAARRLLYIGFELREVSSIYADCFKSNKASIRIFEKIGMRPHMNNDPMNYLRGLFYGEFDKPTVRYRIDREDWSPAGM